MRATTGKRRGPDLRRRAAADRLEVRHTSPAGEDGQEWPPGYYVFVWKAGVHFRALLVRFLRRQDAERARQGLLSAGLITMGRIRQEHPQTVMRIMCENLQW